MLERISQILKTKKLSASQFAVSIGVQPSSVSHVLSGRNKPSLDFITKILSTYPEINAEWLITGKGEILANTNKLSSVGEDKSKAQTSIDLDYSAPVEEKKTLARTKDEAPPPGKEKPAERHANSGNDLVEKIVYFFKDGTFREYTPGKSD